MYVIIIFEALRYLFHISNTTNDSKQDMSTSFENIYIHIFTYKLILILLCLSVCMVVGEGEGGMELSEEEST